MLNMSERRVPIRPSRHLLAHHKIGTVLGCCHMILDWLVEVAGIAVLWLALHYFDCSRPSVSQHNPQDIEHSQSKPGRSVLLMAG